jgi:hypothetical protein
MRHEKFTFLVLLACGPSHSIEGNWKLSSGTFKGEVRARRSGIQVGVWGDKWGTDGWVSGEHELLDGADWFYFPLGTGLGTGRAALRLQGGEARLPLGSRRGEFDIVFHAEKGEEWDAGAIGAARKEVSLALEKERQHWAEGGFLLQDASGETAGVLQFIEGDTPIAMVFDAHWLTPESQWTERFDEGADIILTFPVQPSLNGEYGALRINVPTREAVVPSSTLPSSSDRRFSLEPGRLSQEKRSDLVAAAEREAESAELAWISEHGPALARRLRKEGGCADFADLPIALRLPWTGYSVSPLDEEEGCPVSIAPAPKQHRRHFQGRVAENGISVVD